MNVMNQGLLLVAVQSTVLLIAFLIALRWWNTNPFSRHALGSTALTACMLLPLGFGWFQPRLLRTSHIQKQAGWYPCQLSSRRLFHRRMKHLPSRLSTNP